MGVRNVRMIGNGVKKLINHPLGFEKDYIVCLDFNEIPTVHREGMRERLSL